MTEITKYHYADGDLLEKPHTYQYSEFNGSQFLKDWMKHRDDVVASLKSPKAPPEPDGRYPWSITPPYRLQILLEDIMVSVLSKEHIHHPDLIEFLKILVKKFEVNKRLYTEYDTDFIPVDKNSYQDMRIYLRFAEILERAYDVTNELPYLNALLKLMDILIAYRKKLRTDEKARLVWLIEREREHVCRCGQNCGVSLCI